MDDVDPAVLYLPDTLSHLRSIHPIGIPDDDKVSVARSVPGLVKAATDTASAENVVSMLPFDLKIKAHLRYCPTVPVGSVKVDPPTKTVCPVIVPV